MLLLEGPMASHNKSDRASFYSGRDVSDLDYKMPRNLHILLCLWSRVIGLEVNLLVF